MSRDARYKRYSDFSHRHILTAVCRLNTQQLPLFTLSQLLSISTMKAIFLLLSLVTLTSGTAFNPESSFNQIKNTVLTNSNDREEWLSRKINYDELN